MLCETVFNTSQLHFITLIKPDSYFKPENPNGKSVGCRIEFILKAGPIHHLRHENLPLHCSGAKSANPSCHCPDSESALPI